MDTLLSYRGMLQPRGRLTLPPQSQHQAKHPAGWLPLRGCSEFPLYACGESKYQSRHPPGIFIFLWISPCGVWLCKCTRFTLKNTEIPKLAEPPWIYFQDKQYGTEGKKIAAKMPYGIRWIEVDTWLDTRLPTALCTWCTRIAHSSKGNSPGHLSHRGFPAAGWRQRMEKENLHFRRKKEKNGSYYMKLPGDVRKEKNVENETDERAIMRKLQWHRTEP